MNFDNLKAEINSGVALVTFTRPPVNALNIQFLTELNKLIENLEKSEVRVVIFNGEGKAFIAGADIAQMKDMTSDDAIKFSQYGQTVFNKIEQSNIISIAAINGFALGGGCELAMCCDIRIVSDKAKFSQPEVGLGIIPGFHGTYRLPKLIGNSYAKLMILTGRMIDANEAYRIGLVDLVTSPEDLLLKANEIAAQIASQSPTAVKLAKKSISLNGNNEADLFGECFNTNEQKDLMTAFVNKKRN